MPASGGLGYRVGSWVRKPIEIDRTVVVRPASASGPTPQYQPACVPAGLHADAHGFIRTREHGRTFRLVGVCQPFLLDSPVVILVKMTSCTLLCQAASCAATFCPSRTWKQPLK